MVAETLGVALPTLSLWAAQYREKGLKMLDDQPRPGRPIKISGDQRGKITALACSEPPEGYALWHLRLWADDAVELGYCEEISHTEVASILRKRTEAISQTNLVYRETG